MTEQKYIRDLDTGVPKLTDYVPFDDGTDVAKKVAMDDLLIPAGLLTDDSISTLTNKTLDDWTNHVHADAIHDRAKATENILTGQPVQVTGYNAGEEAQEVALANQATDVATAIAAEDIASGEFGMMITTGLLSDIDTSAFNEKDVLYVNGTGAFTSTKPTTGYMQAVAYVLRSHALHGAIQINVGAPLQSAEDVRLIDEDGYFNSDEVEGALKEVGELKQQTGYDKLNPDTMPDLAFSQSTRTVSVSVKSGQTSFSFWVKGMKMTKTTTQTVVIPDVTGFYYAYFDNDGVLQYVEWTATPDAAFYEYAVTAGVRWNATQGSGGLMEERHGKDFSSTNHKFNHDTIGARYANGMNIEGLADGVATYTQTTYGEFWDEDNEHKTAVASTHGWLYRLGTAGEWTTATTTNEIGHKESGNTYYSWNEYTGTTWQLTEGGATSDYWITFFSAQPAYGGAKITKMMGQNSYPNALQARNAIESELSTMKLDGLPGPEIAFLYAVIVKRDGTLVPDSDGNLIYDLRSVKGGAPGGSVAASNAQDIATDTSGFNGTLSTADTNVQLALDTLDELAIPSNDGWTAYLGTMPTSPTTSGGIDTLLLTNADYFLTVGTKAKITSTAGTHYYYVSYVSSTGFKTVGETSPTGTVTAMKYSYAEAPLGLKRANDWYKAKHRRAASKTLTKNIEVKVGLDTIVYDPNGNVDTTTTYRWTCPMSGVYDIIGSVGCTGVAEVTTLFAKIYINGAQASEGTRVGYSTSTATTVYTEVSDLLEVRRGEYVEIYAKLAAATDRTLPASTGTNTMMVNFNSLIIQ